MWRARAASGADQDLENLPELGLGASAGCVVVGVCRWPKEDADCRLLAVAEVLVAGAGSHGAEAFWGEMMTVRLLAATVTMAAQVHGACRHSGLSQLSQSRYTLQSGRGFVALTHAAARAFCRPMQRQSAIQRRRVRLR